MDALISDVAAATARLLLHPAPILLAVLVVFALLSGLAARIAEFLE